jgi:ankyrin repeat protein
LTVRRPEAHASSLADDLVSRFLDNACPDHHVRGGTDHVRARHTAMRLLERHPEIASASFYTAVVCGDLEAVTGSYWHLAIAIEHNDLELAEWCLAHGATPNPAPPTGRGGWTRPLYEEAMLRGRIELAELLVRHGATRTALQPDPKLALIAACMRSDLAAIRREIGARPELLKSSEPLFAATEHNRLDAVKLLLDLWTSPDVESPQGERALHIAAYSDSVDVARLLIARGAEIDPIGRRYGNTPLGGAMHCQSARMIELLSEHSRSAWEVGYLGRVDRLCALLHEKPERARGYDGETLLMYVPPDDEDRAMEVAELLLAHGADPAIRDPNGATAADRAERNGMYRVAALLRQRSVRH